jgi:hypothetical protein
MSRSLAPYGALMVSKRFGNGLGLLAVTMQAMFSLVFDGGVDIMSSRLLDHGGPHPSQNKAKHSFGWHKR